MVSIISVVLRLWGLKIPLLFLKVLNGNVMGKTVEKRMLLGTSEGDNQKSKMDFRPETEID